MTNIFCLRLLSNMYNSEKCSVWFNLKLKHLLLNLKNEIFSNASQNFFVKYHLIKKLRSIKKSKN